LEFAVHFFIAVSGLQGKTEGGAAVLEQTFSLLVLGLPVACIAWTVTREEILREPREWFADCSRSASSWVARKFCYVWTCEYCFSHYVAAAVVAIADFQLLFFDWRGYLIAWLALVTVANVYMSLYSHLRVEINKDRAELKQTEREVGQDSAKRDGNLKR
jgi:hypothetical protein